jgi:thioredoxin reductase
MNSASPERGGSAERPSPPGEYPVVVVGSGPGALQVSHELDRLGIGRATISADPSPGGMFRLFPLYQRLLSWTKPHAPAEAGSRAFEWYDWNSLISDDPQLRNIMPGVMDGSSHFPSRAEMEENLATFTDRARLRVRYGCAWESTSRADDGRFILTTSDGEYTCRVAIFATGMAEPWKPPTPGIEHVPHYVDTGPAASYAGKRVLIIGKQNSAFEIASGLLPWARQIVLTSPRPTQLSVVEHSLSGVRARYVQPYEDAMLAGGVFLMNAKTESIERSGEGFRIRLQRVADSQAVTYEADAAIATTGFRVPLRDLPDLGVATFAQGKMPSLTPFWESVTVPGIFFAGTITQAASGLRKHGIPSNSGAVHGYRYNAQVLVRHIGTSIFGVDHPRPRLAPDEIADFLLTELTLSPELWNQRSYLARVVSLDETDGARDEGVWPLAHFVDTPGPDAMAATIESDPEARVYPVLYLRRGGTVSEHTLEPEAFNDYRSDEYRQALAALLR